MAVLAPPKTKAATPQQEEKTKAPSPVPAETSSTTIAPEEAEAEAMPYVVQVAADTTSVVLAESYLLTAKTFELVKSIDAKVRVMV